MSPAAVNNWIVALGGRRFVLTVGSGVVNTALLIAGYLTESAFVTLILATVGVFIGANTYQKVQELRSA